MFLKEKKAQGALEYLLIIGGAIVLAVVVVSVVINITSDTTDIADDKFNDFNTLIDVNIEK